MTTSEVAKGIERVLQIEGRTKKSLAEQLGKNETQLWNYLQDNMKTDTMLKILDALGYEVLFRPQTGMGIVNVQECDPCERCAEKVFSQTVFDAMDKLRVHATEQGTEIDFYG